MVWSLCYLVFRCMLQLGAYHEKPDVETEDELAREVEAAAAALESLERALAS